MKIIKENIAELLLLLKFRKRKSSHNLFSKFFRNSKKVLILSGDEKEEKSSIKELLKYLLENGKQVSLLLPANWRNTFNDFSKTDYITYNPIDINFLGMPKNNLIENFIGKDFDTIIDFSINKNFLNIYLIKLLNPHFSVGFEKKFSDRYYNFQIKPETNSEKSYRNLLNSLRMF